MYLIFKYITGLLIYILIALLFYIPIRIKQTKKIKNNLMHEILLGCLFSWAVGVFCILVMPTIDLDLRNLEIRFHFPSRLSFELSVNGIKNTTTDIVFGKYNFVPFLTIWGYLNNTAPDNIYQGDWMWYGIINILGNIILFIPFGFLVPLINKEYSRPRKILPQFIAYIILIELLQHFIGRSSDIDDLILNTLGIVIGLLIYKAFNLIFKKSEQMKR